MDPATSKKAFLGQLEKARQSALAGECGWTFEVRDFAVFVTMRPRRHGCHDRVYHLRVKFDGFPLRAPSFIFVDPTTREMTDAAWPHGVRHGHATPGICTPGTRECVEVYHKNDPPYRFNHTTQTFLMTLAEVQRIMEEGVK